MSAARQSGWLLWICVALFALRVIGQIEVVLLQPAWLPDMEAWYSGLLPYPVLLPAQIAILMIMAVAAWNPRVREGWFAQDHPRAAGLLRAFAVAYFTVMAARLALVIAAHGADFWRAGAIPVAFHWVLALFVIVSARAQRQPQEDEGEELAHGDVPALAPPAFTAWARAPR